MTFHNYFLTKRYNRNHNEKRILGLFLLFIIIFSSILLISRFKSNYSGNKTHENNIDNLNSIFPILSYNISKILDDPFTKNFNDIESFIDDNLKNTDLSATTYFSLTNDEGNVIDDKIYSETNLLLYSAPLEENLRGNDIFDKYTNFRNSPLWYEGNRSEYEYGFIESINATTGQIIESKRNLIDNLIPIVLLCENMDYYSGAEYEDPAEENITEEFFPLINSSVFWDDNNTGFYESNSSSIQDKDSIANLYAIYVNLLVNNTNNIDDTNIKNRAGELANRTINSIAKHVWDNENSGFYANSNRTWSQPTPGDDFKILDVNALGLLTYLEHWIQVEGMHENSTFYKNATILYHVLNDQLWNENQKAYQNRRYDDWDGGPVPSEDNRIYLKANALMMQACLKFFSITGNISFYDRALELYNTFENSFYNNTLNAYITYLGSTNNTNIDLNANIKLFDAYLDAFEIYNNTQLSVDLTGGKNGDFIFSEHALNLTCSYDFISPSDDHDPIWCNITDASILYDFHYPNGTIFNTTESYIEFNKTTGNIMEITNISCVACVNSSLNGTYFYLNTPSMKFYVWFDVNNSGAPDPNISGRIGIKVQNISINATILQVANNISSVLNLNGNFSTEVKNNKDVFITNLELGIAINATDGVGINATKFNITTFQDGENRTVTEHNLIFNITEDIPYDNDYYVVILVNTTYFRADYTLKSFNVISGLEDGGITGLDASLYQGQTVNMTLSIQNDRASNITLNVSVIADGIIDIVNKEVNFTGNEAITEVPFNITAYNDTTPGDITIDFYIKNGTIEYLHKTHSLTIANALNYGDLSYTNNIISGGSIQISLNLHNQLPNDQQNLNISFSGDYIRTMIQSVLLNPSESKLVSFPIDVNDNILEDSIEITITISKGSTVVYTESLAIDIVRQFELISISFPELVPQGETAYLIILIKNNKKESETFSLFINAEKVEANIDKLSPGENRIIYEIIPTINPYEIGIKEYQLILKDNSKEIIITQNFKANIELSTINLILFYIIPVLIPIGIVLFYKNKDLKHKILRR